LAGTDPQVFSIARGIQHYRNDVVGLSKGTSNFQLCYGILCPAGGYLQPYNYTALGANAAQAGAWATPRDIKHQLDYMTEYFKKYVDRPASSMWKVVLFTCRVFCFGTFISLNDNINS
jgi:hypothetical protein